MLKLFVRWDNRENISKKEMTAEILAKKRRNIDKTGSQTMMRFMQKPATLN